MSRARRPAESDPMDLLLDTVSNVFGGVMFLTLMEALLVISRGGSALTPKLKETPVAPATEVDLSKAIEAMQLQCSELNFLLEAQARAIQQMAPSGDTDQKITELDRLRRQSQSTEDEMRQMSDAIAAQESLKNSTEESLSGLEKKRAEWNRKIEESKVALKKIEGKASRNITFSLLRDAETRGVPVLLRYGKVYRLYKDSVMRRVNLEDIEEIANESYLPREQGGQLAIQNTIASLVTKLSTDYPPDRHHVTIAVWDDSFPSFNLLRNQLVAAGYEYRTLPCIDGTVLVLSMGGDQLVQ